jgi:hypothetical protein
MLTKSRPGRSANSTAYTVPSGPIISETCETEVPEAAPKYKTFEPGLIQISSIPPATAAASFDENGFQTRYSILPSASVSTAIRFSP